MTARSSHHATFAIERTYPAPPARVFAAWSSHEAKAQWFGAPNSSAYQLDFRVGGREANAGGPPGGPVYTYDAEYLDIVPDARIVYAYAMSCDADRISASVTTVEFVPDGDGSKLTYTEQGVYLDGHDTPEIREGGTRELLDQLGKVL
ncbi:MAG TPA: SRPBCC family protein [Acidimicrobiales bacterium]|jgi:uncharacterized protein YndB with AHSA1/START domain|nr:SRPBCC family protein [Acidimicrobiales bacterium]